MPWYNIVQTSYEEWARARVAKHARTGGCGYADISRSTYEDLIREGRIKTRPVYADTSSPDGEDWP